MALRVKNVEAGKRVMIGGKLRFIPFRRFPPASDHAGELVDDYDPTQLKRTSPEYRMAVYGPQPRRGRKKATAKRRHKPATRKASARKKNPIPTKWVAANVKRVGNDIQVMLFPKGKVAKRRAAKRRTTRRRR